MLRFADDLHAASMIWSCDCPFADAVLEGRVIQRVRSYFTSSALSTPWARMNRLRIIVSCETCMVLS